MNRLFLSSILLMAAWVWVGTPVTKAAESETADAQDAAAASLVEQIKTDRDPREAAQKLVKMGQPAVAPLAKAAESESVAVVTRCFDVLGRLMVADDEATAKAAEEAIDELSASDIDIVARRARTTLRLKEVLRRREALMKNAPAAGPAGGARMTMTENGKTVQLERAADGSFTGRIKEKVDGEDKVTEIKAASEKELEEKFPEAHKAYQKQQERQIQLGGVPGLGQPGIQINGNFFGGGQGQSIRISVVNNKRRVDAQNGDEKVEITDSNGKDIELKHTRPVDGKAKTDEYKAADLDDLKKKHPEAAKLYEKYTGGNNVVVGGGAVQLQIGAVPGGFQVPRPIPGFRTELPSPPATPRVIRAEQEGRKIEITDEDGMKIRVKMTKLVDGKEVSQEFSAEDLKTLKAEHPEVAKLYEQLTGRKAE